MPKNLLFNTIMESTPPVTPPITSGGYLQMDGVDDTLRIPHSSALNTINKIEIKFRLVDSRNKVSAILTKREFAISGHLFIFVNGTVLNVDFNTQRWNNITNISIGSWTTLSLDVVHSADSTLIVNDNTFTNNGLRTPINNNGDLYILGDRGDALANLMKGDIEYLKLYTPDGLFTHLDMSTGTVQDQSGNGKHAILVGGTWVRGSNIVTNGLIGYWNSKQGFNPTTKTWNNIAPTTLGSYNVTPSIPNDVNVTEKGMTFTPSGATANYFSTSAGFGKTFTSLTIEFYVEHTTRGSNPNLSNVINGFGSDYQLFLFSADSVETAGINFTTTTETERTVILSQPTTINVGSYFSLVIDENLGRTRLYQNGVLIGTVSLTSALDFTNGVFCIGSNVNGFNINGVIDNVRVYERALTDSEITQNFEIKRNIGL